MGVKVVLTSFRDAKNWQGAKFSIARWQPNDMHFPVFPIPIQPFYKGVPLRNLHPTEYRLKYNEILYNHSDELKRFFLSQLPDTTIVLLCWCNPTRQKGYNKLYCHRILVGYWLEINCSWVEIIYADGADNPVWERDEY